MEPLSLQRGAGALKIFLIIAGIVLGLFALIAILAAVLIVKINPAEQFAKANNAQRSADVVVIHSALEAYSIDTRSYPSTITNQEREICRSDALACGELVDLSVLTAGDAYLNRIPLDPDCLHDTQSPCGNGTGYTVQRSGSGVLVRALKAELNTVIEATPAVLVP